MRSFLIHKMNNNKEIKIAELTDFLNGVFIHAAADGFLISGRATRLNVAEEKLNFSGHRILSAGNSFNLVIRNLNVDLNEKELLKILENGYPKIIFYAASYDVEKSELNLQVYVDQHVGKIENFISSEAIDKILNCKDCEVFVLGDEYSSKAEQSENAPVKFNIAISSPNFSDDLNKKSQFVKKLFSFFDYKINVNYSFQDNDIVIDVEFYEDPKQFKRDFDIVLDWVAREDDELYYQSINISKQEKKNEAALFQKNDSMPGAPGDVSVRLSNLQKIFTDDVNRAWEILQMKIDVENKLIDFQVMDKDATELELLVNVTGDQDIKFMYQLINACAWYHPNIVCERLDDPDIEPGSSSSYDESNDDLNHEGENFNNTIGNTELNSSSDNQSNDSSFSTLSSGSKPLPSVVTMWAQKRSPTSSTDNTPSEYSQNEHVDKKSRSLSSS